MRSSLKSSAGFTLIELGMVMVVISFILGPIFSYLTISRDKESYQTTIEKQRKITVALSNFAQQYGYLPCPSRTLAGGGTTDSPSIGTQARRCDTTATFSQRHGIVPFRTLGLNQDDVIDGYGNPFTYVVALSANRIPVNNPTFASDTPLQVFPACYGSSTDTVPRYNKWGTASRHKKYFCCREEVQPLYVRRQGGPLAPNVDVTETQGTTYAWGFFGPPYDLGAAPNENNVMSNLQYFAYVLVSHGKNGEGSYTIGRNGQKPWRIAGSYEQDNGDSSNLVYHQRPANTNSDADYYDDIVVWRTQQQVIAETGSNSCASP